MDNVQKTYRIRTTVGQDAPSVINVPLNQTYDMFDILSLKLRQTNTYKTFDSTVGLIVGRVIANGGVGVENAKISIFLPVEEDEEWANKFIYDYYTTRGLDDNGIRYNLLPDSSEDACYAVVGTFPNKRLVLDNDSYIEIFDKYWKYTTKTNKAGDYMMTGIPVGEQILHMDLDLSDCGILSQRPRDLIGQGYDAKLFESPNKYKKSDNLNSLVQIISQDRSVYVYPYWGDTAEDNSQFAITRCDINLSYEFKPTCVFLGSIITDGGSRTIGKNCTAKGSLGEMSKLVTSEGTIEMIRKTLDGRVESYSIEGDRLIDSDGTWCYQIPMNLDYVTTNEEGTLVPTDNPDKGIATRARVRFRFTLSEQLDDKDTNKRCKYLVPNNPRLLEDIYPEFCKMEEKEADYEFGTRTKDESFVNLFWNNVYTVKNYIPRLQKNADHSNKKHTGIKQIKYYGDNNPMPYNAMDIKLPFTHRMICVLTKVFIQLVAFLNFSLALVSYLPCQLCRAFTKLIKTLRKIKLVGKLLSAPFVPIKKIFCAIVLTCIDLSSEFCEDESGVKRTYYPGCRIGGELGKKLGLNCVWEKTRDEHNRSQKNLPEEEQTWADYRPDFNPFSNDTKSTLLTCIENSLAQENEATSFKFQNDWVNGVLYAPLWFRRIRPKKRYLFGLIKRKAKDQWCKEDGFYNLRFYQNGVKEVKQEDNTYDSYYDNERIRPFVKVQKCGDKCYKHNTTVSMDTGLILTRETMLGQTVYYYKAINYVDDITDMPYEGDYKGAVQLLFATDIVLLGSLNECDLHGVPQFFKALGSTTYNMPTDLEFVDTTFSFDTDPDTGNVVMDMVAITEETGCDWGNLNKADQCGTMGKDEDGGLFYDIGCSGWKTMAKSSVNLRRICEFGVVLDSSKFIPNLSKLSGGEESDDDADTATLRPDGFVSYDELEMFDERSMFATMNGNRLRTTISEKTGFEEYDFRYLYCDNFDGALSDIMKDRLKKCNYVTYGNNNQLEKFSFDYYTFRMGEKPYFYDNKKHTFPRYENSFYFYFGLKNGKTAIEKFRTKFFSECEDTDEKFDILKIEVSANDWCSETTGNLDGFIKFNFAGLTPPYDIIINSDSDGSLSWEGKIDDEAFYFGSENPTDIATFSGYTYAGDMMLRNGDYTITVTDADGGITSSKFSLKSRYLSFNTTVTDFGVDNTYLKSVYGDDYNVIAKKGTFEKGDADDKFLSKRSDTIQREKIDIGGLITVYGIFNNHNQMSINNHEYKITVRPIDSDLYKLEGYTWIYIDSKTSLPECVKYFNITDDNSINVDTFVVGVPRGDVSYIVTVTQLCNGIDSMNSVSKVVNVKQPVPVKLFVNDVDIDLLKNFNSGWKISSGKVDNSLKFRPSISNLSGWNELSNIWGGDTICESVDGDLYYYNDNGDMVLNNITMQDLYHIIGVLNMSATPNSPYNWPIDYRTEYTESSFRALGDGSDELSPRQELALVEINTAFQKRKGVPELVRAGFYMTCPDSPKTISAQLQTNKYPINYAINYPEDFMTEEEELPALKKNASDTKNCTRVFTTDSNVDGIYIPTLTYPESPSYGTSENGYFDNVRKLSFVSAINFDDTKKKLFKTPFVIGACDAVGITKPENLELNSGTPKTLKATSGDPTKYFMFHIIDKVIAMEKIAWSYFKDIPYYEPSNTDYNGTLINMNGILAAKLYNGVATDLGNSLTQYATQEYASYNMLIKRLCEDTEDSLPTRRVLMGIDVSDMVESTLDNLGIPHDNDGVIDDVINNIEEFADSPIISSLGLGDILDKINDDLQEIVENQIGCETMEVEFIFTDNLITEDDEIIGIESNNITVKFNGRVNEVYISHCEPISVLEGETYVDCYGNEKTADSDGVYDGQTDVDWCTIDESGVTEIEFRCAANDGSERRTDYSIVYSGNENHRLDFTIVQNNQIAYVVYRDCTNNNMVTIDTSDVYQMNVKKTKVQSFMDVLEDGVSDLIKKYFYPFKNYKVVETSALSACEDEKTDINMQYMPILNIESNIDITDESGCSPEDTDTEIYGKMRILLSSDSVNDCRDGEKNKLLHVTCNDIDESGMYYLFRLYGGRTYPLNYVVKEDGCFSITNNIENKWENNVNDGYNVFSFKTKDSDLLSLATDNSNYIFDSRYWFKTEIVTEDENGEEKTLSMHAAGNTGVFDMIGRNILLMSSEPFEGQVFCVGSTSNSCRAITPVYDFSKVEANVRYGIAAEPNGEEHKYFGVAIYGHHFYLDNYEYTLSCECDIDDNSKVVIEEQTLYTPNKYVINIISDELYNKIENTSSNLLIKNTIVVAKDYTNLNHICNIKSFNKINRYAYVWHGNLPLNSGEEPGQDTCGILENGEYKYDVEQFYEMGETIEVPIGYSSPTFWSHFLGWSENQADPNNIIPMSTLQNQTVSGVKVYYGNWSQEVPQYSVTFIDKDGNQIGESVIVQHGQTVQPPVGYENAEWYLDGDDTKTIIDLSNYPIYYNVMFNEYYIEEEPEDTYYSVIWETE